ncbi:hypothetical protein PSY31_23455, partial [Shigella flexneri]|nr:hypothetical protein [Shigella flexneri]
ADMLDRKNPRTEDKLKQVLDKYLGMEDILRQKERSQKQKFEIFREEEDHRKKSGEEHRYPDGGENRPYLNRQSSYCKYHREGGH